MKDRVHSVSLGAGLEEIVGLPPWASGLRFNPDRAKEYFVFRVDEGQSELYRLFRYDLRTQTFAPLTDSHSRGNSAVFDPQGNRIAFSNNSRNGSDFDVYVMDPLDPGSLVMVHESDGAYVVHSWSPDGSKLALTRPESHTLSSLHVLDVGQRHVVRILEELGDSATITQPSWSRDGASLFFISDYGSEFRRVYRFDLSSEGVVPVTPEIGWDIEDVEVSPSGAFLVLHVNQDGLGVLRIFDLSTGEMRVPHNPPSGSISKIHMHPFEERVAFDVSAFDWTSDVFTYDLVQDRFTRWTNSGSADQGIFLEFETIRYPTFDSVNGSPRMISAHVSRPRGEGEGPYAVLIDIHGGPASQAAPIPIPPDMLALDPRLRVIKPNVRGSTGYGKTFAELDNGLRREDAVRDIGALLDWIADQPDLDSDRVAVWGGSYGGYMTLATLVHFSDRLRCGWSNMGISNFNTFLDASEERHFPDAQRAEFGDNRAPEVRRFLESISPRNHADRINVPLGVFQGANDVRVRPEESRQMVAAIRERGGEVWYVEASDAGHNFGGPLNWLYLFGAIREFWERCLLN
jgi:dipeptidyl aminopeptidase/acylaminoacyl peptidase